MASPVPDQNWACNVEDVEFQGVDSAILMSLLDDSEGEENDEDGLNCLIRSLEAEIVNSNSTMDSHSTSSVERPELVADREDGQLEYYGQPQYCSMSHDQLGFGGVDIPFPLSPRDDLNRYMDPCEYEMDGIIEFGGLGEFSHTYCGIALEEQGYRSLWQETYDSVMFD